MLGPLTPEQRASIRFELLVSGAYEASEPIPEAERHRYGSPVLRFADAATTTRSLRVLLEAGWDVRALARAGALTERGEWLAGAVAGMRQYLGLDPVAATGQAATPGGAAPPAAASAPPVPAGATPPPAGGGPGAPPPGPPARAAAQPAGGDEPWRDLRAVGVRVDAPAAGMEALARARQLGEEARALRDQPVAEALPAMQLAFDAAAGGYRAASGAYQAYVAAYTAAQIAVQVGGPAASGAEEVARQTHELWQQAHTEHRAALAANEAAQRGGPQAAHAAVEVASHSQQAAWLSLRASEAAEQVVAAAGQVVHGAGRARTFESDDAAGDYAREVWAGLRERLTREQDTAVSAYSGAFHRTINRYLRGEVGRSELTEEEARNLADYLPLIDQALAVQPTTDDLVVVRSTTTDEFDTSIDRLEGTVQSSPTYLSTSLGAGIRFAADRNVALHLHVPAGTPALFMEATYDQSGPIHIRDLSQELLLGRSTTYTVDAVVPVAGRWHVYGRVIPPR